MFSSPYSKLRWSKTLLCCLVFVSLLVSGGCVSKKAYQAKDTELARCEEEKTQAAAAVIAWETRFDREAQRWDEMEGSITESLPQALSEFHAERDRILELVPEQVQFEIAGYLEDYFSTVMKGFEALKNDNDAIKMHLEQTQQTLVAVGTDTRTISADTRQIKEIRSTLDNTLAAEQAKRQQVQSQITEIVSLLSKFDEEKINCKSCENRLRLKRKEREALTAFHAQLTRALTQAQSAAGE
jgi:chromosome segregation ATPase